MKLFVVLILVAAFCASADARRHKKRHHAHVVAAAGCSIALGGDAGSRVCSGGAEYRCTLDGDPHLHISNGKGAARGEAMNIGHNWVARFHNGVRMVEVQGNFIKWGKRASAVGGVAVRLVDGSILATSGASFFHNCRPISAKQANHLPGVRVSGVTVSVFIDHVSVVWGATAISYIRVTGRQCDFKGAHGWCAMGYNKAFYSRNKNAFVPYNPACVQTQHNLFSCAHRGHFQKDVAPTQAPLPKIPKRPSCTQEEKDAARTRCSAAFNGFDLAKCHAGSYISDCVEDWCASRSEQAFGLAFTAWRKFHHKKDCSVQVVEQQTGADQLPQKVHTIEQVQQEQTQQEQDQE